jgi:Holliday junction resolvase RusA-like endonuclease
VFVFALAARSKRGGGIGEPVRIELVLNFSTKLQARWGAPHTIRPDGDNLAKLVLDAVVRAGLLADDGLVASLTVSKLWVEPGSEGVRIVVVPAA